MIYIEWVLKVLNKFNKYKINIKIIYKNITQNSLGDC